MNYYIKSKKLQLIKVLSFIITTAICQQKKESSENNSILVAEWAGSYGGTPAFDKMNIEDIKPALEKGMAEKLASEIMSAAKGEGAAVKKREDTHKMAESNRAFAHFKA